MMRTQSFPPPYKGERDDIPMAAIENPYAETIYNFNLNNGVPTFRYGDSIWYNNSASSKFFLNLSTYGVGSNQKLFGVYADSGPGTLRWVDLTTAGSATSVHTFGAGTDDEIHTLFFNNYLFFFGEATLATTPQYYNGSAWGSAGYTWPGSFNPFGGAVYKNRAYFIGRNSAKYAYSDVQAISGTTTEVDLTQIISVPAYLYGIRSISSLGGTQQQNVLAFIFSSGEVLIYSGSYPNSSDWTLINRSFIPEPIYYNAFIDAKGDSFVLTKTDLISLRTLFVQGAEDALSNSLSSPIKNKWTSLFQNIDPGFELFVKGNYDSLNDRIVIFTTKTNTSNYRLIYSFKTGSWAQAARLAIVSLTASTGSTVFQNNIYYAGDSYLSCMQVEGNDTYIDLGPDPGTTDTGYYFEMTTAPLYTESFGSNATVGIEMLCTTDGGSAIEYSLKGNLGQTVTAAQTVPAQGSGVTNPYINIGIDANYLQFTISGYTTDTMTIGTEIYALNLWSQKGGVR